MLYRYEVDGPQFVGHIGFIGAIMEVLSDRDAVNDAIDACTAFNEDLPVPPNPFFDANGKSVDGECLCFFTEAGEIHFHDAIMDLIEVYKSQNISIRTLVIDETTLDYNDVVYHDEYQMVIHLCDQVFGEDSTLNMHIIHIDEHANQQPS